jgi:putative endonuclease
MAGLGPAIHVFREAPKQGVDARHKAGHRRELCFIRPMGGWVYMMSNRRNGTLYVGVASDLPRRAYQHREGLLEGFTKRYGLKRLVYFEQHDDIRAAIQREKNMKHWPHAWKVRLIHGMNAERNDLYDTLF